MLGRRSCRWRDSMSAVGGRDTTAECERVPGSMQMSPCGSACAAVMRGQGPARVGDLLKVIHAEKDKAFLFFLMSPSSHVTVEAGDRRESVYSERWLLQAVLLFLPSKDMGFYPFIQLQNKFSKKKKKKRGCDRCDRILKLGPWAQGTCTPVMQTLVSVLLRGALQR